MADVMAQVVLQAYSNKPEDRFVNTFHFTNSDPYGDHSAGINTALQAFYNAPSTAAAIAAKISPWVSRSTNVSEIRTYNMSDPSPREPLRYPFTLGPVGTSPAGLLPAEVAIVLSFYGASPKTPSRRGRVYIGPLDSAVAIGTNATSAGDARPNSSAITMLTAAAVALKAAPVGWAIYSRKHLTMTPVVGGWVDNAFDIQRRRGQEATTRTIWGS